MDPLPKVNSMLKGKAEKHSIAINQYQSSRREAIEEMTSQQTRIEFEFEMRLKQDFTFRLRQLITEVKEDGKLRPHQWIVEHTDTFYSILMSLKNETVEMTRSLTVQSELCAQKAAAALSVLAKSLIQIGMIVEDEIRALVGSYAQTLKGDLLLLSADQRIDSINKQIDSTIENFEAEWHEAVLGWRVRMQDQHVSNYLRTYETDDKTLESGFQELCESLSSSHVNRRFKLLEEFLSTDVEKMTPSAMEELIGLLRVFEKEDTDFTTSKFQALQSLNEKVTDGYKADLADLQVALASYDPDSPFTQLRRSANDLHDLLVPPELEVQEPSLDQTFSSQRANSTALNPTISTLNRMKKAYVGDPGKSKQVNNRERIQKQPEWFRSLLKLVDQCEHADLLLSEDMDCSALARALHRSQALVLFGSPELTILVENNVRSIDDISENSGFSTGIVGFLRDILEDFQLYIQEKIDSSKKSIELSQIDPFEVLQTFVRTRAQVSRSLLSFATVSSLNDYSACLLSLHDALGLLLSVCPVVLDEDVSEDEVAGNAENSPFSSPVLLSLSHIFERSQAIIQRIIMTDLAPQLRTHCLLPPPQLSAKIATWNSELSSAILAAADAESLRAPGPAQDLLREHAARDLVASLLSNENNQALLALLQDFSYISHALSEPATVSNVGYAPGHTRMTGKPPSHPPNITNSSNSTFTHLAHSQLLRISSDLRVFVQRCRSRGAGPLAEAVGTTARAVERNRLRLKRLGDVIDFAVLRNIGAAARVAAFVGLAARGVHALVERELDCDAEFAAALEARKNIFASKLLQFQGEASTLESAILNAFSAEEIDEAVRRASQEAQTWAAEAETFESGVDEIGKEWVQRSETHYSDALALQHALWTDAISDSNLEQVPPKHLVPPMLLPLYDMLGDCSSKERARMLETASRLNKHILDALEAAPQSDPSTATAPSSTEQHAEDMPLQVLSEYLVSGPLLHSNFQKEQAEITAHEERVRLFLEEQQQQQAQTPVSRSGMKGKKKSVSELKSTSPVTNTTTLTPSPPLLHLSPPSTPLDDSVLPTHILAEPGESEEEALLRERKRIFGAIPHPIVMQGVELLPLLNSLRVLLADALAAHRGERESRIRACRDVAATAARAHASELRTFATSISARANGVLRHSAEKAMVRHRERLERYLQQCNDMISAREVAETERMNAATAYVEGLMQRLDEIVCRIPSASSSSPLRVVEASVPVLTLELDKKESDGKNSPANISSVSNNFDDSMLPLSSKSPKKAKTPLNDKRSVATSSVLTNSPGGKSTSYNVSALGSTHGGQSIVTLLSSLVSELLGIRTEGVRELRRIASSISAGCQEFHEFCVSRPSSFVAECRATNSSFPSSSSESIGANDWSEGELSAAASWLEEQLKIATAASAELKPQREAAVEKLSAAVQERMSEVETRIEAAKHLWSGLSGTGETFGRSRRRAAQNIQGYLLRADSLFSAIDARLSRLRSLVRVEHMLWEQSRVVEAQEQSNVVQVDGKNSLSLSSVIGTVRLGNSKPVVESQKVHSLLEEGYTARLERLEKHYFPVMDYDTPFSSVHQNKSLSKLDQMIGRFNTSVTLAPTTLTTRGLTRRKIRPSLSVARGLRKDNASNENTNPWNESLLEGETEVERVQRLLQIRPEDLDDELATAAVPTSQTKAGSLTAQRGLTGAMQRRLQEEMNVQSCSSGVHRDVSALSKFVQFQPQINGCTNVLFPEETELKDKQKDKEKKGEKENGSMKETSQDPRVIAATQLSERKIMEIEEDLHQRGCVCRQITAAKLEALNDRSALIPPTITSVTRPSISVKNSTSNTAPGTRTGPAASSDGNPLISSGFCVCVDSGRSSRSVLIRRQISELRNDLFALAAYLEALVSPLPRDLNLPFVSLSESPIPLLSFQPRENPKSQRLDDFSALLPPLAALRDYGSSSERIVLGEIAPSQSTPYLLAALAANEPKSNPSSNTHTNIHVGPVFDDVPLGFDVGSVPVGPKIKPHEEKVGLSAPRNICGRGAGVILPSPLVNEEEWLRKQGPGGVHTWRSSGPGLVLAHSLASQVSLVHGPQGRLQEAVPISLSLPLPILMGESAGIRRSLVASTLTEDVGAPDAPDTLPQLSLRLLKDTVEEYLLTVVEQFGGNEDLRFFMKRLCIEENSPVHSSSGHIKSPARPGSSKSKGKPEKKEKEKSPDEEVELPPIMQEWVQQQWAKVLDFRRNSIIRLRAAVLALQSLLPAAASAVSNDISIRHSAELFSLASAMAAHVARYPFCRSDFQAIPQALQPSLAAETQARELVRAVRVRARDAAAHAREALLRMRDEGLTVVCARAIVYYQSIAHSSALFALAAADVLIPDDIVGGFIRRSRSSKMDFEHSAWIDSDSSAPFISKDPGAGDDGPVPPPGLTELAAHGEEKKMSFSELKRALVRAGGKDIVDMAVGAAFLDADALDAAMVAPPTQESPKEKEKEKGKVKEKFKEKEKDKVDDVVLALKPPNPRELDIYALVKRSLPPLPSPKSLFFDDPDVYQALRHLLDSNGLLSIIRESLIPPAPPKSARGTKQGAQTVDNSEVFELSVDAIMVKITSIYDKECGAVSIPDLPWARELERSRASALRRYVENDFSKACATIKNAYISASAAVSKWENEFDSKAIILLKEAGWPENEIQPTS